MAQNDYIQTTANITHGINFTYEAQVKFNSVSDWMGIVCSESGTDWVQLVSSSTGYLRAELRGNGNLASYNAITTNPMMETGIIPL